MKDNKNSSNNTTNQPNNENSLFQLLIGIILLGAGLFMLSKRIMVHSSWYMWRIGNFDLSSGTVVIPLLIGIIWFCFNTKSLPAKILITLSTIFIVLSIIMSVKISFMTTSMFDFVLTLGMTAAGAGLLLRGMFKK